MLVLQKVFGFANYEDDDNDGGGSNLRDERRLAIMVERSKWTRFGIVKRTLPRGHILSDPGLAYRA